MSFLRRHGRAFGLGSAGEELVLIGSSTDRIGGTHLAYAQRYAGVPVFGALVRVHFDAGDALSAVNGTLVPDIGVSPAPSRGAEEARRIAFTAVQMEKGADNLAAAAPELKVFREGLAKGVPGENHLAWEVEVGNGSDVREFVYVDAHTGKIIDQITGIHEGLDRRAYDAQGQTAPGPNYPAAPFWVEGQPFPTASAEANNMIQASKETYDVFWNAFGRDGFDGTGAIMDSIFNRGNACPNASWNGIFISFCPGTTSDDVTAHEWGHAYTQYTHNLIYQWQPGALNESYSDIWGEVVDRINGRGTDLPDALRTAGACSAFSPPRPTLRINSPSSIAGTYAAGGAAFGPALTTVGLTGNVVLVNDGVAGGTNTTSDGCDVPFVNAGDVSGNIALVDRGTCGFAVKVKNAQNAGAVGVIVANNVAGVLSMGGADPTITIPSLLVSLATGNLIKAQLGGGVNATLAAGTGATDNSLSWLIGEDASAFGGAIRDMWNPTCYANPGKVTDIDYYVCSTADGGGVHSNSGVPNHAFALLVDGGTYNGQTVGAIGLTKAAHIYYRAQSVYQTPASNFAEHADALEASCADLTGAALNDLVTGSPSGPVITAGDCAQISKAVAAVELRTPPAFCNFQPLLRKSPPPRCGSNTTQIDLFRDDFESGAAGWLANHVPTATGFVDRDWVLTGDLPDRSGSGFFGPDPDIGTCAPGGDQSGTLYLTSPAFTVPSGVTSPLMTFDHWVATEPAWDGGNLQISVNGGAWTLVPAANFTFNPYNLTLQTAGAGNTNPLAGQPAFSGTDGGSVEGSWGRSHVNLAGLAPPGASVRLRWALGTDGCGGRFGWYVDDVTAYTCTLNDLPTVSVDDITANEGTGGTTTAYFTLTLSHAFPADVKVRYELLAGSAKTGSDFQPAVNGYAGAVVIKALTTSVTVPVLIKGDKAPEGPETFSIELKKIDNGTVGDGTGVATILDDDSTQ
jgi:Zn-dependent metalloprotease